MAIVASMGLDLVHGDIAGLKGKEKEPCSFCGEPSVVYHVAPQRVIFVCQQCAIQVLPKLIADSVYLPTGSFNERREYSWKYYKPIKVSFREGIEARLRRIFDANG